MKRSSCFRRYRYTDVTTTPTDSTRTLHSLRGGGRESAPSLEEFCTTLHNIYPDAKIILLVDQETAYCAEQLLTPQIAGCLLQEEISASLVHLIRAVAAGETVFSRAVVAKLVEAEHSVAFDYAAIGLTEREADVLELMVCGYANGEIAAALCLSPQTVRNKATRIYSKVGVGSRVELLAWARQRGLG